MMPNDLAPRRCYVNAEALQGDAPPAAAPPPASDAFDPARAWFATQGWSPFPFQEEVWSAFAHGESGLLHAPTGMGKTYAAWMPPLCWVPPATPTRLRR